MLKSWIKWCINHDVKFVLYILWFLVLPSFLLAYTKEATTDAIYVLDYIKNTKKGDL